jgi:hypothetical protein
MASNVADLWLWFPSTVRTSAAGVTTGLATGVIQAYPIPSRCQVKQWGIVVVVKWPTHTTDPVIKLQKVSGTDYATTTDLATFTIGPSNTSLFFPTVSTNVAGAGGPGTVYTGPALGGNRTAATAALIAAGVVLLGPDTKSPSAMIEAGDLLQVNVTTQGATAGTVGQYTAFARLEVAGESVLELTDVAQDVS